MLELAPISRSLVSTAVDSFAEARTGLDTFIGVLRRPAADPVARRADGLAALSDIVRHVGGAKEALHSARTAARTEAPALSGAAFDTAEEGVEQLGTFARRMLGSDGRTVFEPMMEQRRVLAAAGTLDQLQAVVSASTIPRAASPNSSHGLLEAANGASARLGTSLDDFIGALQRNIADPVARREEGMTSLLQASRAIDDSLEAVGKARIAGPGLDDASTRLLDHAARSGEGIRSTLEGLRSGSVRKIRPLELQAAAIEHDSFVRHALARIASQSTEAKPPAEAVGDSLKPVFQRPAFATA